MLYPLDSSKIGEKWAENHYETVNNVRKRLFFVDGYWRTMV